MKFIIGHKLRMSQKHRPDGRVFPVTVIRAEPCTITQLKKNDPDGYDALQVGSGRRRRVKKPMTGHLKKISASFAILREFRPHLKDALPDAGVGDKLDVSQFTAGDKVNVVGISKTELGLVKQSSARDVTFLFPEPLAKTPARVDVFFRVNLVSAQQ